MTISQTVTAKGKAADRVPPGPTGSLLGSLLRRRNPDRLEGLIRTWRKYGDIVFTRLGPLHNYMLFNPDYVHHVLVGNQKNYIKGIGYNGFRLLAGQGLVTSDGDLWKEHRRMMSPYFTPTAVTARYSGLMTETITHMLTRWEGAARAGEALSMDSEMMRLTMSIIGRTLFSLDLGAELSEVGRAIQEAFAFIPVRALNPLLPISVPTPTHRRFKRNLKIVDAFIAEQIALGRAHPERENLMGVFLKAQDEESGHRMTDQMLRDEAVTLFFAGFETTARSLTWGWYRLWKHPEVLERVTAEAEAVLGGREPTGADLEKLVYTRQVIDETLRLYPPTALLARQNVEADEIGGYPIPPRSLVTLVPYVVHRYPDYWPEAENFDPGRFTPEAAAARPKSAYIPFAAGPRICLGNSFALMEMVYTFAMAAGRFHMQRLGDDEIRATFVGTTRPSLPLVMKPVLRS